MISIKLKYSLTGYHGQYQGEQNVKEFLEWYLSQKKARQYKQEINANKEEIEKFIESKFFNKTSHAFPGLENATDHDWKDYAISKLHWNEIPMGVPVMFVRKKDGIVLMKVLKVKK